jgi:hypothetical protein
MKTIASYNKENKMNIAETIASTYANTNIPDYIKRAILDRVIWIATENDDNGAFKKYFGQPYWSEGALKQLQENRINKIRLDKNLRHEHSVPKKEIIKRINACNKSKQDIFDILDIYAHSVVVSLEEDGQLNKCGLKSKMPTSFHDNSTQAHIFSRYDIAKIKVYNIGSKDPREISKEEINSLEIVI